MGRLKQALTCACGIAVMAYAFTVRADAPREDPDVLFEQGNKLMDAGRNAEACPLFARSLEIDPSLGTRVNLALCLEKIGQLGSSYRLFQKVVQTAHDTGKVKREDEAREHLESMRATASHVVLTTADPATDVVVRVDGADVPVEARAFYPLDPGEHLLSVIAPKKKPYSSSVTVKESRNERHDVAVPLLTTEIIVEKRVETVRVGNPRRTGAYIAGGVGALGVVAAAVTGILVLDAQSTADHHCTIPEPSGKLGCDSSGSDAVKRGEALQWVNVAGFGVAAAGLGVGGWLFFTSKPNAEKSAFSAAPFVGPSSAGVTGTF